jgi:hypothetical protein
MSATFREFLREKAAEHEAQVRAGKANVEEWREAVQRLFAHVKEWLAESDPDGILKIHESTVAISEPGLGRYEVPRLELRAFGRWVALIPKARKTVGTAHPPQKQVPERADGRVDVTDEMRRYVLYRFREAGGDSWLIDDLRSGAKPLDKDAFEKALMSYFR